MIKYKQSSVSTFKKGQEDNNLCKYCQTSTTLQCKICEEYFCNNASFGISHIIYHMVKTKHTLLCYGENGSTQVKCYNCSEENVFKMGYEVNDKLESFNKVGESLSSIMKSTLSVSPNISFWCRTCRDSKPLIKDKVIDIFPSEISYIKISHLESSLLPTVKTNFTPSTYLNTFTTLVLAEMNREKEVKEAMKQENVTLRFFENFVYFYFQKINDLKINIGDEIRFTRGSLTFRGFVCVEQFSEELKVKLDTVLEIPHKTGYTVEYVWRPISYERMIWALNKIYKARNKNKIFKMMLSYKSYLNITNSNNFSGNLSGNSSISGNFTGNSNISNISGISGNSNISGNLNNIGNFTGILNNSDRNITTVDGNKVSIYSSIDTPKDFPVLNSSQEVAVKAALENPLTLIQGPPGTGKTLVSSVIVYNIVKKFNKKVFVIASSNTAVDQLASKINKTGLKVLRVVSKRRETIEGEIGYLCLHNLLKQLMDDQEQTKKIKNKKATEGAIRDELINAADVVCCTCVSSGMKMFNRFTFPVVLIDEAVQCTEPLSLIPCVYSPSKLILVGDHKQLGPTVLSKDVIKANFKQSLFERLIKMGHSPYLLSTQYRMSTNLCEFPSDYFYSGYLKTCSENKIRNLGIPMNFFYVSEGKEEVSQSGTSYLNRGEAILVENIIRHLFKAGVLESSIGIITPYEGQRSHILDRIVESSNLEISNVDGFQGREKDFIIISLVRSNNFKGLGFVDDKRRMNVTLTRAKYGLFIIGNPHTLNKSVIWNDLLKFYDSKGLIYQGPITNLSKVDNLIL